jgi:hypothetical protein
LNQDHVPHGRCRNSGQKDPPCPLFRLVTCSGTMAQRVEARLAGWPRTGPSPGSHRGDYSDAEVTRRLSPTGAHGCENAAAVYRHRGRSHHQPWQRVSGGVQVGSNIRISCGPPPKAEKQGLELYSQISRTHERPPARLLHSSVIALNPAGLAECRQNYLLASGLVAGCSARTDARRSPLAAILSTGLNR